MGIAAALVLLVLVGAVALYLRGTGSAPLVIGPRLSPQFGAALLQRAGFPVTEHNLAALHERLGRDFLAAAVVDPDARVALAARCEAGRHDVASWPQRVLDELAAAGHASVTSLVHRCPADLLATAGTGRGFFGGSVFEPLPTVRRALTGGDVLSVPAPRPAASMETVGLTGAA